MASKWVNANVLDSGLNYIKTNATRMVLLSSYTPGDSASTINANTLAYVNMTSGDYTISNTPNMVNPALNDRVLNVASGKTAVATASASGNPDLHIAFTNGTTIATEVIWVTDETSNQNVTSGNTINFPSPIYRSNLPI
jgi:hypothetical protein